MLQLDTVAIAAPVSGKADNTRQYRIDEIVLGREVDSVVEFDLTLVKRIPSVSEVARDQEPLHRHAYHGFPLQHLPSAFDQLQLDAVQVGLLFGFGKDKLSLVLDFIVGEE